jgi:hypothetical protein
VDAIAALPDSAHEAQITSRAATHTAHTYTYEASSGSTTRDDGEREAPASVLEAPPQESAPPLLRAVSSMTGVSVSALGAGLSLSPSRGSSQRQLAQERLARMASDGAV